MTISPHHFLMKNQKMITLVFSIDEVNSILGALSKFPYEQVKTLIEKIQEQANPQVIATPVVEE